MLGYNPAIPPLSSPLVAEGKQDGAPMKGRGSERKFRISNLGQVKGRIILFTVSYYNIHTM